MAEWPQSLFARSVLSVGIEPTLFPPQGNVLSIERRELFDCALSEKSSKCHEFPTHAYIVINDEADASEILPELLLRTSLFNMNFAELRLWHIK